jgi:hypothetical protein
METDAGGWWWWRRLELHTLSRESDERDNKQGRGQSGLALHTMSGVSKASEHSQDCGQSEDREQKQ